MKKRRWNRFDIKNKKRRLRGSRRFVELYAVFSSLVVASMLIGYTVFVAQQLSAEIQKTSMAYATFQTLLASQTDSEEMAMVIIGLSQDIGRTMTFPSIVTDAEGNPMAWSVEYSAKLTRNPDENQILLRKFVDKLDRKNKPIEIVRYTYDEESGRPVGTLFGYFHYGSPSVINLLFWLLGFELILIASFSLVGLISYRRLKAAETEAVWAGLARETAHQLGTPISSLIGWHEVLKEMNSPIHATNEPLDQMLIDISHLRKIADKFQEIGAPVNMTEENLVAIIERVVDYGRRRIPKVSDIRIETDIPEVQMANVNPLLFEWVVENLVKNAVDVLVEKGEGKISIILVKNNRGIVLTVSDNGPGIDPTYIDQIFNAGFTTKSKGWGLGLALVKRIVCEIHKGKISVDSKVGQGTTFIVKIPILEKSNRKKRK